MKQFIFLFLCFALMTLNPSNAAVHQLNGQVIRIIDGDTFEILIGGTVREKIRMKDIDAPEKKQAYGQKAKQTLAELIAGKMVRVVWEKRDRNQRILGTVFFVDRNINLQMVQSGMAWHFKKYSNDPQFARAEKEARSAKRGLWLDSQPLAPWLFRAYPQMRNKS
jgi:micrococcal nuclease